MRVASRVRRTPRDDIYLEKELSVQSPVLISEGTEMEYMSLTSWMANIHAASCLNHHGVHVLLHYMPPLILLVQRKLQLLLEGVVFGTQCLVHGS